MNKPTFLQNAVNKCYKAFSKEPGKMLLYTGTAGWIFSAMAQIGAVVQNKEISKEQKEFLIPQEIADAVVNIIAFAVVTSQFKNLGKRLVTKGKLITPKIKSFLNPEQLKKVGTKDLNIANLDAVKKETNKDFAKTYNNFADGVDFAFTTLGSIISCNIITPILRNRLAAWEQKRSIAHDKKLNMKPYRPVLPAQNRLNIEAYAKRTSINPAYSNNGSMKI